LLWHTNLNQQQRTAVCRCREETHCRFCQNEYGDWRQSLTPRYDAAAAPPRPATPIMAISFEGQIHYIKVRTSNTYSSHCFIVRTCSTQQYAAGSFVTAPHTCSIHCCSQLQNIFAYCSLLHTKCFDAVPARG
jgi:hypothetical protein